MEVIGISFHALRAEGDFADVEMAWTSYEFQSTPSGRRATQITCFCCIPFGHFNPRPPGGGRRRPFPILICETRFQSTPSGRRATSLSLPACRDLSISIHALRAEGDLIALGFNFPVNISIHALRAEGDYCINPRTRARTQFQSTPSGRRATSYYVAAT